MRSKRKTIRNQRQNSSTSTLNRFANLLLEDELEKTAPNNGTSKTPPNSLAQTEKSADGSGRTPTNAESVRPQQPVSQPIVWIDCEMTGLSYEHDKIIEIAVIITDGQLNIVDDDGLSLVVHQPKEVMNTMGPWCRDTHGKTGLTKAVSQSTISTADAENRVLKYIQKYVPERKGLLAGSSVHADRAFLLREMPKITDWLHYRIIDVSSIKELKKRWFPDLIIARSMETQNGTLHRALDDIKASIDELKGYRETIFIQKAGPVLVESKSDSYLPKPVTKEDSASGGLCNIE